MPFDKKMVQISAAAQNLTFRVSPGQNKLRKLRVVKRPIYFKPGIFIVYQQFGFID
jgi:hypothetical protein